MEPEIGIRLRLAGKGAGRWERSGGDRAKFGLTIGEAVAVVSELEKAEALDCLKLLHFHIGSQLTKISSLKDGLKEATQVYVQLKKRCKNLNHLDIGGGLGVDYDGSKTSFASSMNYSVEEYARDVVWVVGEVCEQAKVQVPNIVTEAGRATCAHHSILVFNVLGIANTFEKPCNPQESLEKTEQVQIQNMARLLIDLTQKNCQETLHDAIELRTDIISQFKLGLISIEDRALADECYWALLSKLATVSYTHLTLPTICSV